MTRIPGLCVVYILGLLDKTSRVYSSLVLAIEYVSCILSEEGAKLHLKSMIALYNDDVPVNSY